MEDLTHADLTHVDLKRADREPYLFERTDTQR